MKYKYCSYLIAFFLSPFLHAEELDYLYRFPEKGGRVLEYSLYVSADEMEFDDRSNGVEEVFEVERVVMGASLAYRYSLYDHFLINLSTEADLIDFDTHLEDENENEYFAESPLALYNPELALRYRFVDKKEAFFDIQGALTWGNINYKKSPMSRTVSPFEGQKVYRIEAISGIRFNSIALMGSVGTNMYQASGNHQFEFDNIKYRSENSNQVLLGIVGQKSFSSNVKLKLGFKFLSADTFSLYGQDNSGKALDIEQSTQQNYFFEVDYLGYQKSIGILSILLNKRLDRYTITDNASNSYAAENTFLDFVIKIEKWF